jgi:hypothetical protein
MYKVVSWEHKGHKAYISKQDGALELWVDGALRYTYKEEEMAEALDDWHNIVQQGQQVASTMYN